MIAESKRTSFLLIERELFFFIANRTITAITTKIQAVKGLLFFIGTNRDARRTANISKDIV
jgi:hypothetical protein